MYKIAGFGRTPDRLPSLHIDGKANNKHRNAERNVYGERRARVAALSGRGAGSMYSNGEWRT